MVGVVCAGQLEPRDVREKLAVPSSDGGASLEDGIQLLELAKADGAAQ